MDATSLRRIAHRLDHYVGAVNDNGAQDHAILGRLIHLRDAGMDAVLALRDCAAAIEAGELARFDAPAADPPAPVPPARWRERARDLAIGGASGGLIAALVAWPLYGWLSG